jgi:hypothetical protein
MSRRITLNFFTEAAHISGLQRVNGQSDETIQAGGRLLQRLPPEPIGQNLPISLPRGRPYFESLRAKPDGGSLPPLMSITTSEGEGIGAAESIDGNRRRPSDFNSPD